MNTELKYRFTLYTPGYRLEVNPSYKEDITKTIQKEGPQAFYRERVNTEFTFFRSDYDFIADKDFESKFTFRIYKMSESGSYNLYWTGLFSKADCEFNEDDKICTVKIEPKDDYTDILAGLDKEFDLLKLQPFLTPFRIDKRPLIQVYSPGQERISCFIGGSSWEQDVETPVSDTSKLTTKYMFALASTLYKINFYGYSPYDCLGDYVGKNKYNLTGANSAYKLTILTYNEKDAWGNPTGRIVTDYSIIRVSDNLVFYEAIGVDDSVDLFTLNSTFDDTIIDGYKFAPITVYSRYLCDVDYVGSTATTALPIDDFVGYNINYRRALRYAFDLVDITARRSTDPTEFGVMDNNYYFKAPYIIGYAKYYPILRDLWAYSSIWFRFDTFDWILERKARKPYVNTGILVSDAIQALLRVVAPHIEHRGTITFSRFLNATNPISGTDYRTIIVPKSNITAGENSQPAQKAVVTLGAILNMLRDVYRCYWYIENRKLKVEHEFFFRNGMSYEPDSEVIGVDLTTEVSYPSKKTWGTQKGSFKYQKEAMPERYEFGWMDDVSTAFKGYPIEIKSGYSADGRVESINVSSFTSDVDYMQLNPTSVSLDGFAVLNVKATEVCRDRDYVIQTTGSGRTAPYIEIKKGLTGRWARLTVSAYGSGTAKVVFGVGATFDEGQGNIVLTNDPTTHVVDVIIPSILDLEPTMFAFQVMGSGTFTIMSFRVEDLYEISYTRRYVDDVELEMQNGSLSWVYLHPTFYIYGLPAKKVRINNADATMLYTSRRKIQEIEYPSFIDPSPYALVKTSLGNGQVESIDRELLSGLNKITLKYDTE